MTINQLNIYLVGQPINRKRGVIDFAETTQMVLTYMSLMMYTSMHKGFFEYEANKQVMDYTIAHLDNTFLIRQLS